MKQSLKDSLKIARKRERENPSIENTIRVRKIIYLAMVNTNKRIAQKYKEKYLL